MENQNTKILNERGEKKMSNKTRDWLTCWIETETNKVDGSAKEKKKENISKTENLNKCSSLYYFCRESHLILLFLLLNPNFTDER